MKLSITALLSIFLIQGPNVVHAIESPAVQKNKSLFTENKGQLINEHAVPVSEFLYYGKKGNLQFFMKKTGVSYQLSAVTRGRVSSDSMPLSDFSMFRVDLKFKGANTHCSLMAEKQTEGYLNFYQVHKNTVGVKSYESLWYKNLYAGIDLHYYEQSENLKYDFIVRPLADPSQIQIEIHGAVGIQLLKNGDVLIKTPIGNIVEEAPVVLQRGKKIAAAWVLKGKCLSLEISEYDHSKELIIDPITRSWGTYFGGTTWDDLSDIKCGKDGKIYITGSASDDGTTVLSTPGVFQTTPTYGTGYLAKFDANGNRRWCTYFMGGQTIGVTPYSCDADSNGFVFMCGMTGGTSSVLATPNAFQMTGNGMQEGFLARFDSTGQRSWSTYYGTAYSDFAYSCATDGFGNVYFCGMNGDGTTTTLATPGAFQTTFGLTFLAKFNAAGARVWGTYYSGFFYAHHKGVDCSTDPKGNVYLAGSCPPQGNVASSGAHQTSHGGGNGDAYVAKFTPTGQRVWGTYYGGAGGETGMSCTIDNSGNVFLTGYIDSISSSNIITTAGCAQPNFGGGYFDGFIVKFDSLGVRKWGSYLGGNSRDQILDCATDVAGNLYITGSSHSANNIATAGAYQANYAGGNPSWYAYGDALLAQYSPMGIKLFGSYYGGADEDVGFGCTIDRSGHLYIGGRTLATGTLLGTPGAFQPAMLTSTAQTAHDGYFAKFLNCASDVPLNITPIQNTTLCAGQAAVITVSSSASVFWYSSLTSSVVLSAGSNFKSGPLSAGSYSWYAGSSSQCNDTVRTVATVTVFPKPQVTAPGGTICAGQSFMFAPSGAINYSYSSNSAFVSPSITTQYTIIGVDNMGCSDTTISTVSVLPLPIVLITSSQQFLCAGTSATLSASGGSSYYWHNAQTSNTIAINPFSTSTYAVTVTGSNGCSVNTIYTQVVEDCTDLAEEENKARIVIQPNPAFNYFTVTGAKGLKLQVLDAVGRIIFVKESLDENEKVEIPDIAEGLYQVVIYNESGRENKKLLLKH